MEFAIFSNGERNNPRAADSYDEDLREIVAAAALGYREAWISEHLGTAVATFPDLVSAVEPFIGAAAALTHQIRLGPAVRPLAGYHPVQVAMEAAVVDHLTHGRYSFGFGAGGPTDDSIRMRGLGENTPEARRGRMKEAIDLVIRCWTEPAPFNHQGTYYHGEGIVVVPKPYQQPHPPIAVASYESLETIRWAGERGFLALLGQFDGPAWIREKADAYEAAAHASGSGVGRRDLRVCRLVYVTDSVAAAKRELRETLTPAVEFHKRRFPHHFRHSLPPSGRVEDLTLDHLIDGGHYLAGDPDTVAGHVERLYEETGGFGTLMLLMGKNYATLAQRERSLRLFMGEVAPRLRPLLPSRGETAATSGALAGAGAGARDSAEGE